MLAALTFLKSDLFKYLLLAALIAGGLYIVYDKGEQHVQAKWDAEKAATKVAVAENKVEQAKVTTIVETKYVDRIKIVKEKGDVITKEVPVYITKDTAAKFGDLPVGFIRMWNESIQRKDVVSDTTGLPNDAPSGIELDAASEVISQSNNTCVQVRTQLLGLQEWITAQKKLNP